MKKLVVLLLVSLMATSAFATVDPDPDMLGIYFDLTADNNCTTAGPGVAFTAYVFITNPSAPLVYGVEYGYTIATNPPGFEGSFFRLSEILPAGSLNVGNAASPLAGDYIVGFSSPAVGSGNNVLCVTWSFLLLAPGFGLDMTLGASNSPSIPNGLPAMEIGGTIVPLGTSTGTGNVTATVNGDCVVANEDVSFGSVKSLFR
jgi:hypothetical protein